MNLIATLVASEPEALLPARWQMAVSLGSHIVLACFGVAFPAMVFVVHRRGLRDEDAVALGLAQRWSKVAAWGSPRRPTGRPRSGPRRPAKSVTTS